MAAGVVALNEAVDYSLSFEIPLLGLVAEVADYKFLLFVSSSRGLRGSIGIPAAFFYISPN